LNNSPEIENIIEQAIASAKERNHQYVTIEHLLLALVTHPPFKKCLNTFNVDTDLMVSEIEAYLNGLHAIESKDPDVMPRKTNSLERVMNRSVTQVLFTGRRQVLTIDLYLSMAAEGNSHAHYFLLKYGVNKQDFVAHWQKTYKGSDYGNKLTDNQADEILEEHTINLTQLARQGKLEPVIGRHKEIDDIINVLAVRLLSLRVSQEQSCRKKYLTSCKDMIYIALKSAVCLLEVAIAVTLKRRSKMCLKH